MEAPYDVVLQQTLNPTSSAAVAAPCPAGADGVFISVNTQDARVSFSGAATASVGVMIKAGAQPTFFPIGKDLSIIGLNVAASDVSLLWVR